MRKGRGVHCCPCEILPDDDLVIVQDDCLNGHDAGYWSQEKQGQHLILHHGERSQGGLQPPRGSLHLTTHMLEWSCTTHNGIMGDQLKKMRKIISKVLIIGSLPACAGATPSFSYPSPFSHDTSAGLIPE